MHRTMGEQQNTRTSNCSLEGGTPVMKVWRRKTAWLGFLLLGMPCWATTIDFTTLGSLSTPALSFPEVTVTGSANIATSSLLGLGVLGGINTPSGELISEDEFITVSFNALADGILVQDAVCGGALCGQSTIAAFGTGGVALGTSIVFPNAFPGNGLNINALFGNQALSSFRLTVNNDGADGPEVLTIRTITFTSAPEPTTTLLTLTGLALLLTLRNPVRERNVYKSRTPSGIPGRGKRAAGEPLLHESPSAHAGGL
jgi:hypothetical protein